MRRRWATAAATGLVLSVAAGLTQVLPTATAVPEGTVVLKFYDTDGNGTELTTSQAKRVMHGAGGSDSDALVDPANLQVTQEYPLYAGGSPSLWQFDIPGHATALAVNWPTEQGYSTVVLDDGGAGFTEGRTIVFNWHAALDAKRRLDSMLAARPDYDHSEAFNTAYAKAESNLKAAAEATTSSGRGKYGQRALDAAATATATLLAEYGPQYARDRSTKPQLGLTVDDPTAYAGWAGLAKDITGSRGWVRLVFDPTMDGGDPAYYREAVGAAHAKGLKVLGQPIDSTFANQSAHARTRAQYFKRVKKYVDYFPDVDAWEVANEVNGCWLDSETTSEGNCTSALLPANDRIKNKIADAAEYVKQKRPDRQVVLTFYWQLGTDAAKWSVFNWARANLPDSVRENIDILTLSTYVEDAPMGLAFDQVMRQFAAEFPDQKIQLGELDYWIADDTSQLYWAFNKTNTAAARREVAAHYYAAMLGYPTSLGGGYWWAFPQEMPDDPALQDAVRSVATSVG